MKFDVIVKYSRTCFKHILTHPSYPLPRKRLEPVNEDLQRMAQMGAGVAGGSELVISHRRLPIQQIDQLDAICCIWKIPVIVKLIHTYVRTYIHTYIHRYIDT